MRVSAALLLARAFLAFGADDDDFECFSFDLWRDGHCEPLNNFRACDWDGGDCCESTCADDHDYVLTECGDNGYQCRDPDAPDYAFLPSAEPSRAPALCPIFEALTCCPPDPIAFARYVPCGHSELVPGDICNAAADDEPFCGLSTTLNNCGSDDFYRVVQTRNPETDTGVFRETPDCPALTLLPTSECPDPSQTWLQNRECDDDRLKRGWICEVDGAAPCGGSNNANNCNGFDYYKVVRNPLPGPPAPVNDGTGCAVPNLQGDGRCDDANNEDSCNWDGGDCCPSTCEPSYQCGDVVRSTCKDPYAKEGPRDPEGDFPRLFALGVWPFVGCPPEPEFHTEVPCDSPGLVPGDVCNAAENTGPVCGTVTDLDSCGSEDFYGVLETGDSQRDSAFREKASCPALRLIAAAECPANVWAGGLSSRECNTPGMAVGTLCEVDGAAPCGGSDAANNCGGFDVYEVVAEPLPVGRDPCPVLEELPSCPPNWPAFADVPCDSPNLLPGEFCNASRNTKGLCGTSVSVNNCINADFYRVVTTHDPKRNSAFRQKPACPALRLLPESECPDDLLSSGVINRDCSPGLTVGTLCEVDGNIPTCGGSNSANNCDYGYDVYEVVAEGL